MSDSQLLLFGGESEPVAERGKRVDNDYYPTPVPVTQGGLDVYGHLLQGKGFEPCAGHDAITDVVIKHPGVSQIVSTDITWGGNAPRDACTQEFWQYWVKMSGGIDFVITNPPFNLADVILPLALENAPVVCMLLRLSYQEPCEDRDFWLDQHKDQMVGQMPINPRVKFRRDTKGGDSVTCAWFIWDRRWSWEARGIMPPFQYLFGWR